jgi:hypothetical protein
MASTYTLISSNVLSSSAASVTFSAIPSTYTDLVLRWSARSDYASDTINVSNLQINSDSGANYSMTYVRGNSSAASSSRESGQTQSYLGQVPAAMATSNTFNNGELYFSSYTASQIKPISSVNMQENNTSSAGNAYVNAIAHLYNSTTAISSIKVALNGGNNFVSGSSFYLYGIKNS